MRMFSAALAAFLTFLAISPLPAAAQTMSEDLRGLFTFGACGDPVCLNVGGVHGQHFNPAAVQGQNRLIGFLSNSIGRAVANFNISSGSGGRTIRWVGGERIETSRSAGPIFAERSQTLGRGALLAGVNISSFSFQSLRGQQLSNMRFSFAHQNVGPAEYGDPAFENDLVQVDLDLSVSSLVSSFYLAWGLTDRLDLSAVVPFVRAEITGTSVAQVVPFGNGFSTPHTFSESGITATTSMNAATSGIGDIALRAKVNIEQTPSHGFALLADVRLPTGAEEDFLGSGELAVRGLAIYSAQLGDVAPHVNVGFVGRGGELLNDGLLASVGFDQLLASWFTLAVDVISEWQVGENKVLLPEPVTYTSPVLRTVELAPFDETRNNIVDLSLGTKLDPAGGLSVVANLLVPLNRDRGLRPTLAWTAGIEYRFDQ